MNRKRLILVALAGAVGLWLGIRAIRGWLETEEDRVRAVINGIIAGAEEKDLGEVLSPISEGYRDKDGLGKHDLRGLVFMYFQQHKTISIRVTSPIEVRIRKDGLATAVFYARFAEGAMEGLVGSGDSVRFEVDLQKEDGSWRVVTHRREEAQR